MKNIFHSLRTLTLAIILSLGISYAYAAWAPPLASPTGGNTDAPVNVGNVTQVKGGGLGVTGLLEVGVPSGVGSLLLKTYGNIGADKYCDRDGNNCIAATALGGAGSSFWAASGNDIFNTNTGNVNVNSGGCYYKFQNGALHTNCDVTHDVISAPATFSGSTSGFAGAQRHCLVANGNQIYYSSWCSGATSPITISGCTINGPVFDFGNTGDPAGTLTANNNQIVFSGGGTWTSSCQLTGSLNIVGGGGGVSITGNGSTITANGHGSSGIISVVPSGNQNAMWGTRAGQINQCPNISNGCNSACSGQLTTGGSCSYETVNTWGSCSGSYTNASCPSIGYLVTP